MKLRPSLARAGLSLATALSLCVAACGDSEPLPGSGTFDIGQDAPDAVFDDTPKGDVTVDAADPDAAEPDASPDGQGDAEPDGTPTVAPPAVGQVVFSEIMRDPAAVESDFGEWFELTNVAAVTVDLGGCTVSDLTGESHVVAADALVVAPGAQVVFAANGSIDDNGGVVADYVYGDDLTLGNGHDALILTCAGLIVDQVVFDAVAFPATSGAAMQLSPEAMTAAGNDAGASWCNAKFLYGDGDLGSPGEPNPSCEVDPCAEVACDAPPAPSCLGDLIQTWAAVGVCKGGQCTYPLAGSTDCGAQDQTCEAGQCVVSTDPCKPNPCTDPPAGTCADDDLLTVYAPKGSCNSGTGQAVCTYADQQVYCSATFATCEDGACVGGVVAPVPGQVIFTEFMPDPKSVTDVDGEWFEVKNVGADKVNLNGCRIADLGNNKHVINAGGPLIIEPGQHLVFGRVADPAVNGGVPVDYYYGSGMSMANDEDELILECGGVVIDMVAYDNATFPVAAGVATQLSPGAHTGEANDAGAAWCPAQSAFGDGDKGTPGAANETCPDPCAGVVCDVAPPDGCDGTVRQTFGANGTCQVGKCVYPTVSTFDCAAGGEICIAGLCLPDGLGAPAAGEVLFTEIMKDPAAVNDTAGEWFEVMNVGPDPVILDGCTLTDAGSDKHTIKAVGGVPVVLVPGDPFLFARNGDPAVNGGLTADYVYGGSVSLGNTQDALTLTCGEVVIDQVAWTVPPFPGGAGVAMQLHPDQLDAVDNDSAEFWCGAAVPYGAGDLGTPGALNSSCEDPCAGVKCNTPPANSCDGDVALTWAASGACHGGECQYLTIDEVNCAATGDVCVVGTCVDPASLCDPNPCTQPPAAYCVGDTLFATPAVGACAAQGADVTCEYAETQTDCTASGQICKAGACAAGVPMPSAEGELLITEVHADPLTGGTAGEWFEVHNPTAAPLRLGGCELSDLGTNSHVIAADGASDVVVPPGGFLVLGRIADPTLNGGVPVDYAYGSGMTLNNTGDQIILTCGTVEVDQVAYDKDWPMKAGVAASLDLFFIDPVLNDDPEAWCLATGDPYGPLGDLGTPGQANPSCP